MSKPDYIVSLVCKHCGAQGELVSFDRNGDAYTAMSLPKWLTQHAKCTPAYKQSGILDDCFTFAVEAQ